MVSITCCWWERIRLNVEVAPNNLFDIFLCIAQFSVILLAFEAEKQLSYAIFGEKNSKNEQGEIELKEIEW